jgi:hypothetical protein
VTTLRDSHRPRSPERLPDPVWHATIRRVRAEFDEMPSVQVTGSQACTLFGLREPISTWILMRLKDEGFLTETAQGGFVRRTAEP